MDSRDRFIDHSLHTSMFFPQSRLMVAGNPKAAGTTLRWWLLQAHGIDVRDRTSGSWWGESAPYQVVWDDTAPTTYIWPQLSPEERRDALESADVLTVRPIRNPVTRAFSAWSSKYLVNEPYYEDRLPEEFPRLPDVLSGPEEIGACFETFMVALQQVVTARGFEGVDVHLWPQHRLLAREPVGATLLLRQEAMADGLGQISQHLRSHGVDPGEAPRINETVVPYRSELITDSALTAVLELYDGDFATYGYDVVRPPSSSRPVSVDWLNDVRGRNQRYGVLHRALRHHARENERLRHEIGLSRGREAELLESTSWKVTSPLRWASDRVRMVRGRGDVSAADE